MDEQRVLDVPLEDDALEATSLPVHAEKVLLDVGVDLLQVVEDADAEAAVRGLAWLEDPEVLVPLGLVCIRLEEGSVLGVAFEVVLQLYQVRLGHVVVDWPAAVGVVVPHVEEEVGLLGDFVDAIDVVVDLVRQELLDDPWPPHLGPDEADHLDDRTGPGLDDVLRHVRAVHP